MSSVDYTVLNSQLREYYASLSPSIRNRFVTTLQEVFLVKNRRNALLWVTSAGVQRNFLTTRLPELEMRMREKFAEALLSDRIPTAPQKSIDFGTFQPTVSRKVRQYLADDWTREAATSIEFSANSTKWNYDADSPAFDDIDEDTSDEWDTIPTDPDEEAGEDENEE